VLAARFPGVHTVADVRDMRALPRCAAVTAGFPCTDLSQAGRKAGIDGAQSGLVLTADGRGTFGDARGITAQNDSMKKAHVLSQHVGALQAGAGEVGLSWSKS